MNGIEILAGIILILFGIRFLRKGMDRLFGGRLLVWLGRVTTHRGRAFAAGLGAGSITPSSTSISLLAVQLLADPRIQAGGVLAIVLGANLGMTVLVQAMAFPVHDLSTVAIMLGGLGFLCAKGDLWRGIGQCLLALGFIFLAIQWISRGAGAMAESSEAIQVFILLQGHPWMIFLGTMFLVVFLQSSTAVIGLGIGLSASGLLDGTSLFPWVLGANIGVGVGTFLLAGRSDKGRNLGLASILAKLTVALPLMILPVLGAPILNDLPGDAAQKMALGHSLYNLVTGIVALPFLDLYLKAAEALLPGKKQDPSVVASYLDAGSLETPSLALARATRETLRMSDKVRAQLEGFWQAFRSGDAELAERVQKEDDTVDHHNRQIIDFLSRIEGGMSVRDNRWRFALIGFVVELEAVGDLLEKHLCDLVAKQRGDGAVLDREDWQDLESVYGNLLQRFDHAMGLLSAHEPQAAEAFVEGKRTFNEDCRQLQAVHFERFQGEDRAAQTANSYFLDYLNGFRRIHSHITSVAYVLIESRDKDIV